jgi:hypothetical protein
MMRSTARLLILLTAMTGLGACQTARVVGSCPPLAPPPLAAVDALQAAADSAVDAWVVSLDRHYQKLAVCAGS